MTTVLASMESHKLREYVGPYLKSQLFCFVRKGDKKEKLIIIIFIPDALSSIFIPHPKLIENMIALWHSYKYYVAISSMCLGNFQQPSFFVLRIPNRIHVDPYVFFLTFVRANFP